MPKNRYGSYNPLFVYREDYYQITLEDAIQINERKIRDWEIRHRMLGCMYKTKSTKSGRMLEVEIYPSFLDRKDYTRAIKQQKTGTAQRTQNIKNAQRKLIRKVHSNFVVGDIFFTGGFSDEMQPQNIDECRRFISNFLNTLKYSSKKACDDPFKYIYVIERTEKSDGSVKYHVHILLSASAGHNVHGIDKRDWIESKWKGGDYANTKSLQWHRVGGFTGISKYFTKQFEELDETERPGLRHWGQSIGLKKWSKPPAESYARFKKRRVERLIKAPATLKDEFEKEYPGYDYQNEYPCEIRYSDAVEGFYLYCRMYRRE